MLPTPSLFALRFSLNFNSRPSWPKMLSLASTLTAPLQSTDFMRGLGQ